MMRKITLFIALVICFSACGYKPLAHNTQKTLGDKIYIEVKIDPRDPQNSVTLKMNFLKAFLSVCTQILWIRMRQLLL